MAIERQPRGRIERKQAAVQARQDALRDIETKLKSLKTRRADLTAAGSWAPTQTVTLDATPHEGRRARHRRQRRPARYDVEVTALATHDVAARSPRRRGRTRRRSPSRCTHGGDVQRRHRAELDDRPDRRAINADSALPVTARNYNGQLARRGQGHRRRQRFTRRAARCSTRQRPPPAPAPTRSSPSTALATRARRTPTPTSIPGVELDAQRAHDHRHARRSRSARRRSTAKGARRRRSRRSSRPTTPSSTRRAASSTEKRVPNAATITDAKKGVLFGDSGADEHALAAAHRRS